MDRIDRICRVTVIVRMLPIEFPAMSSLWFHRQAGGKPHARGGAEYHPRCIEECCEMPRRRRDLQKSVREKERKFEFSFARDFAISLDEGRESHGPLALSFDRLVTRGTRRIGARLTFP